MMRVASRLWLVLCGLTLVCWRLPAFAVALDTEGDIKLGTRVYTAARIGTEHTDFGENPSGVPSTFPESPAGHLRQHRTFMEAEFDHSVLGLIERDVGPFGLLNKVPFGIKRLKYHLTYRGEMEGIYDYGPKEYRTADQFEDIPPPTYIRTEPPLNCPAGDVACAEALQAEFIAGRRKTLRARATQRHRLFQAFIDLQVGDLFVRFGRQILSWGETDAFRLLDNINPLDSSFGGFLISLDERRIPLDMVRANYYFGSIGPFSEIFLEGYAAFDNEWGGYPGIPQGSPWQLPNLGRPNANLVTFAIKPPTTVENTRGGGQLKFNAEIPAIGDATFGIAHYYTYFDLPALQLTAAVPLLEVLANSNNLYDDGAAVHAIQTAQRVQVTGASTTFVIPAHYARKIFLGGEPVIRSELAYFHREPRYHQSEVDPFYFAIACNQTVPPSCDVPGGALPPGQEVIGKRRVGDSWNFVVGVDMNQFIRWINPTTSVFFSTQFFYKHLNGALKRGSFQYEQLRLNPGTPGEVTGLVDDGEVLPVPEVSHTSAAPVFVHNPIDQYLQTLLISTTYAGGQVIPSLTLFYDWFGSFVAIPSVTLSRDPFRFTLSYNYLNASRLRGASGTSLLRDRDNVLFQFEYVM